MKSVKIRLIRPIRGLFLRSPNLHSISNPMQLRAYYEVYVHEHLFGTPLAESSVS